MDEKYDCVIMGTGLTECILSGLLSVAGKKVLHIDRNDYYGGESSSLDLNRLYQQFKTNKQPNEALGRSRDYNVDIIPKFILSSGELVKMLVHTGVAERYLDFKQIDGAFVLSAGTVEKVPTTATEALSSGLMGFFEKRRFKKFLEFCGQYDPKKPSTTKGMDFNVVSAEILFKEFSLKPDTIDFVGHAIALYRDDTYLKLPAKETIDRCDLYRESLMRYGKAPFIYPLYGLGELPQAFARLSAIWGGTYMLSKPVEEIVYDEDGKAIGVKSEGEVAKCDFVVGDPSYFKDKVKKVGQVVRAICILDHPIPNTKNSEACQLILPQKQCVPPRHSDIYISVMSGSHKVAPQGKYIAIVSTTVETNNPKKELLFGLKFVGKPLEVFYTLSNTYVPTNDSSKDNCFISKSYDATTHFETTCEDIKALYKKITGTDLDLSKKPTPPGEQQQQQQ